LEILKLFISFLKKPGPVTKSPIYWQFLILYLLTELATLLFIFFVNSHTNILAKSQYDEAIFDSIPWYFIVFIGPIFEELFFRSWLSPKIMKKYLYIGFWASSISFGLLHTTNFSSIQPITILLVAPQLVAGALLGYIRVAKGLRYSICTHCLWNGLVSLFIV
jgi:membrane protease YdiL (CAAX protease family)